MPLDPFEFDPKLDEVNDDDMENQVDPLDSLLSEKPSPLPVAPDGGFRPMNVGLPKPLPKATEDTFVCLRGPCRHYFESRFVANVENQDPEHPLTQTNRWCHRMPGLVIDLMDEPGVVDCSEWDPYTTLELRDRALARAEYASKKQEKENGE